MSSSRKSTLLRILEIDNRIDEIKRSSDYRNVKKNLNVMEATIGRRSQIRVRSLQDSSKVLELRRNSDQMKTVLSDYKDSLKEYTDEIERLTLEKRKLRRELFPQ
jgi:hypothetical protein